MQLRRRLYLSHGVYQFPYSFPVHGANLSDLYIADAVYVQPGNFRELTLCDTKLFPDQPQVGYSETARLFILRLDSSKQSTTLLTSTAFVSAHNMRIVSSFTKPGISGDPASRHGYKGIFVPPPPSKMFRTQPTGLWTFRASLDRALGILRIRTALTQRSFFCSLHASFLLRLHSLILRTGEQKRLLCVGSLHLKLQCSRKGELAVLFSKFTFSVDEDFFIHLLF